MVGILVNLLDNAIEAAGEGGRLLVQKTACEGKTLAIAERKWSVKF